MERNSDIMASVISPFIRNVVGKGVILQAETGNPELNKEIEKLWKVWTKKRNCDVTGTQSLNQILRLAVRRKKVDGGILIVKRFTRSGVLPFKLQLFEVDELDASQVAPKHQGNRVVGGIEYDRFNAPVGYWIRQYTLDGMSISDPVFLKADEVIFYFSKRRPSQLREMSDMKEALNMLKIENPAVSFSNDFRNGVYGDVSEEERQLMRDTVKCISSLWQYKDVPEGISAQHEMSVLLPLINAVELVNRLYAQLRECQVKIC